MELIADTLLAAGALAAGFYCFILGRRLRHFNSLEKGVGGAVAVLSSQVEDLKNTLESAQQTAAASAETLTYLNVRAEDISKRLELQLAALHDLPSTPQPKAESEPIPSNSITSANQVAEPMFIRHSAGAR